MKYLIKVKNETGQESWISSFAEYVAAGAAKPVTYSSEELAEQAAAALSLKDYEIVAVSDGQ